MQVAQAIDYLETAAAIHDAEMAPAMLTLMRSCARLVASQYPVAKDGTIDGYYDPEFEGVRANVRRFLFRAQKDVIPPVIADDIYGGTLDLI